MIIEHTPRVDGFASRWKMGEATLILPLGHGEYPLPEPENEEVHVEEWLGGGAWDGSEGEDKPAPKPPWLVAHEEALRLAGGNYVEALGDEDSDGWATLVLLRGPVYELWRMFYQFANSLDPEQDPADYTPGGDDGTFDYYPSGFECLTEWADDLDKLDEQYHRAVLTESENWQEHMRRYADRGRHAFTARHRVVGIVSNLRVAKGPFSEWEFEDYARPFLGSLTSS